MSVATSIGLYNCHNPELAERKSGMPEGVEIPAPVKATVDLDARMSLEASTISDFTLSDVTDGFDLEWMVRKLRYDPPSYGFDR